MYLADLEGSHPPPRLIRRRHPVPLQTVSKVNTYKTNSGRANHLCQGCDTICVVTWLLKSDHCPRDYLNVHQIRQSTTEFFAITMLGAIRAAASRPSVRVCNSLEPICVSLLTSLAYICRLFRLLQRVDMMSLSSFSSAD
jgi:hypothetical protein